MRAWWLPRIGWYHVQSNLWSHNNRPYFNKFHCWPRADMEYLATNLVFQLKSYFECNSNWRGSHMHKMFNYPPCYNPLSFEMVMRENKDCNLKAHTTTIHNFVARCILIRELRRFGQIPWSPGNSWESCEWATRKHYKGNLSEFGVVIRIDCSLICCITLGWSCGLSWK